MDNFLGVELNARKRLSDTSRIWLHFVAGGCLVSAIALWAIPPWLLEKDSPKDQLIQGVCFTFSLIGAGISAGIGYCLNRSEPYLKAQEKIEKQDYQHLLATSKIASQSRREKALKQFIEGTLDVVDQHQDAISIEAQTVQQLEESQVDFYNWADIVYEANAFLIGGNPGSAKTTLVSGYLVPMLSRQMESEIIVCDPDARVNEWEEKGYTRIISDYEEIFQILKAVATEKEARKNKDWHHQIILILDELNDCQSQWEAESPSQFKASVRYIKSLGNARKYGITPFIMMQNHLVDSIGLRSKDRNQFAMILLCASARDEASQKWKQTDERWQWVNSKAYSVILTGSIIPQLAIHPTHGHHTEFRKEGNPPENVSHPILGSVQAIPSFRNSSGYESDNNRDNANPENRNSVEPPQSYTNSKSGADSSYFRAKIDLNKSQKADSESKNSDSNNTHRDICESILKLLNESEKGYLTPADVQPKYFAKKYNLKATDIIEYFQLLERINRAVVLMVDSEGGKKQVRLYPSDIL